MPIASKMRTLGDAGLYKYKWCNNLREVEQVDIFFLKDIADTIRYFVGNNIGFLYHNESKLFVCIPDSSTANVQHAVSQLFNSNIVVEYQNNTNLIEVLSAELGTLLGEGNYNIEFDNEERLITIDIPFAMLLNLEDVKKILNRTYLMNINIELLVDGVPVEYTLLEYLESSGTQYIDTGEFLDSEWSVTITAANTAPNNNNNSFYLFGFSYPAPDRFILSLYCEDPTKRNVVWAGLGDFGEMFLSWDVDTSLFHTFSLNKSMLTFDGSPALEIQTNPFSNSIYTSFLFKVNHVNNNGFIGRVNSAILYKEDSKKRDFRCVLDATGTPCMYDTVSRVCFYNVGSGSFGYRIKRTGEEVSPMSLRDPYYVSPSGIWAKLIAENELDIIADTDMQDGEGQGYTWFANTGEAYEHFGIKEEPLNNI